MQGPAVAHARERGAGGAGFTAGDEGGGFGDGVRAGCEGGGCEWDGTMGG